MRPLNLGETLDASIKIVRARWRTLAMVMIVVALPIQIANVVIISSTTDTYQVGSSALTGDTASATTYSDEGAYVAGRTIIIALTFLGYLLGTVACYRAIADTYLGRVTGARASLRDAGRRLGATLWLSIILVVGIVLGFVALIVPGIWLAIAWSVAYPVMLVEGTGGFGALKRSFKLVEGHWWATCGRLLVAYILVQVITTVAALIFLIPAGAIVDDTSFGALVLESAANFVASLVTTPFIAAVVMLVYFDLRVRKEGFDLALLAERMGGGAAADPAPVLDARDAFGNPVVPRPAPAPSTWDQDADRGASAASPPGWAPPPAAAPDREGSGSVPPPGWAAPARAAPRAPGPFAPPTAPAPAPDPSAPAPGGWAPPVAPEPRRPPSQDE